MTAEPFTIDEDESMSEAILMLRQHQIRHLPVVNENRLVGIVTDRDLRRASPSLLSGIAEEDYQNVMDRTPVSRIMTRDPLTVRLDTELVEAVRIIIEKKISSLPVVNEQELVGILTDVDALHVLVELLSKSSP